MFYSELNIKSNSNNHNKHKNDIKNWTCKNDFIDKTSKNNKSNKWTDKPPLCYIKLFEVIFSKILS